MKIFDRILWYFYLHLCIFSFISDISANRPIQSRDSKSELNILDRMGYFCLQFHGLKVTTTHQYIFGTFLSVITMVSFSSY